MVFKGRDAADDGASSISDAIIAVAGGEAFGEESSCCCKEAASADRPLIDLSLCTYNEKSTIATRIKK